VVHDLFADLSDRVGHLGRQLSWLGDQVCFAVRLQEGNHFFNQLLQDHVAQVNLDLSFFKVITEPLVLALHHFLSER
jgi:hypothetical protein